MNPDVDRVARFLLDNFREETRKTVRLMTGAMNAALDQLEAAQKDERSQATRGDS
jgi:hypothetical protein